MRYFKLENLWLCRLVSVLRNDSNIMILHDAKSTELMVLDDEIPVFSCAGVPHYFNLEGKRAYHATQKTVYTVEDIGKTFVMYRHKIPVSYLSEEEIRTQEVSESRVRELAMALAHYRWME